MSQPKPKPVQPTDLSEQERELITYYRALTVFNQRRVITIARNAYDDVRRATMLRENNPTCGPK